MRVLILNHQHIECGVYQFAKRIYTIASRSKHVEYFHVAVSNRYEYIDAIRNTNPNFIVYNWHWDRMPWLLNSDIIDNQHIKHYFIYHDGSMFTSYDKYLFFGDFDPDKKDCIAGKSILLPRPLFDYFGEYPVNKKTTIGSFGFAFNHKEFHTLVKLVNDTFIEATINLHLTNPYFGDTPGNRLADIIALCRKNNTNVNVDLNISTEFLDDVGILTFLAKNDINVFSYQQFKNPGLSSATDYALSVKRPIAITNNMMFRHIVHDEMLLEKYSIFEIMKKGTSKLEKHYDLWSTSRFSEEFDKLFLMDK